MSECECMCLFSAKPSCCSVGCSMLAHIQRFWLWLPHFIGYMLAQNETVYPSLYQYSVRLMKIMNGKWLDRKKRSEEKIAHMIMATAAAAATRKKPENHTWIVLFTLCKVLHDFFVENVNNNDFHQNCFIPAHINAALYKQPRTAFFCHLIQLTRTTFICTQHFTSM